MFLELHKLIDIIVGVNQHTGFLYEEQISRSNKSAHPTPITYYFSNWCSDLPPHVFKIDGSGGM